MIDEFYRRLVFKYNFFEFLKRGISRETFAAYRSIYEKFFALTYEDVAEIKFAEKNLTVNFSKAYEATAASRGEEAFSFFEVGFGNKKHLDCVIVNDTTGELFAIEAKRFGYQFYKKSQDIGSDIARIAEFVNGLDNDGSFIRWQDFPNRYGVILADIWNVPREFANWWDQFLAPADIISGYADAEFLDKFNIGGELTNVQYDVQADISGRNYYLLTLWWKMI